MGGNEQTSHAEPQKQATKAAVGAVFCATCLIIAFSLVASVHVMIVLFPFLAKWFFVFIILFISFLF